MPISGFATTEGTAAFAKRFGDRFRQAQELTLSSIGLGTYLGDATAEADRAYTEAVAQAYRLGINVFDSAINYRFQRSERSIGAALVGMKREEVFVATKAGFLTPDGEMPAGEAARQYFEQEYFSRGILHREEIVGGMHCMTPRYLENQLQRSLANLGLETIDLFYLHNPETQLAMVDYAELGRRLAAAFEFLEAQVEAGKIRFYGAATWNGFRQPPGARGHLPLEAMVSLARQAGGTEHHFRFIQLPHSIAMPEASTVGSQSVDGEARNPLEAAQMLGVSVMTSATLMQARVPDMKQAIQFALDAEGVTTALIGMGQAAHVEENLRAAS